MIQYGKQLIFTITSSMWRGSSIAMRCPTKAWSSWGSCKVAKSSWFFLRTLEQLRRTELLAFSKWWKARATRAAWICKRDETHAFLSFTSGQKFQNYLKSLILCYYNIGELSCDELLQNGYIIPKEGIMRTSSLSRKWALNMKIWTTHISERLRISNSWSTSIS